MASHRTFDTSIGTVAGHGRLRAALEAMVAGGYRGAPEHHRALLEGVAAPESRLLTYDEIAQVRDRARTCGWVTGAGRISERAGVG
jgi:hypothetical protein